MVRIRNPQGAGAKAGNQAGQKVVVHDPKQLPKQRQRRRQRQQHLSPRAKARQRQHVSPRAKTRQRQQVRRSLRRAPGPKVKDSQEGEEMSPQKTPPQRISRDAGEHSEPKVEAPPGRKRSAPATKGDAKVAKVRAAKGEAASFARRNPPTTTRPLAEWTAIKNAFRSKLDDFPHRYKNEDCIPIKQMFLNLPVEIVFFQMTFGTKT